MPNDETLHDIKVALRLDAYSLDDPFNKRRIVDGTVPMSALSLNASRHTVTILPSDSEHGGHVCIAKIRLHSPSIKDDAEKDEISGFERKEKEDYGDDFEEEVVEENLHLTIKTTASTSAADTTSHDVNNTVTRGNDNASMKESKYYDEEEEHETPCVNLRLHSLCVDDNPIVEGKASEMSLDTNEIIEGSSPPILGNMGVAPSMGSSSHVEALSLLRESKIAESEDEQVPEPTLGRPASSLSAEQKPEPALEMDSDISDSLDLSDVSIPPVVSPLDPTKEEVTNVSPVASEPAASPADPSVAPAPSPTIGTATSNSPVGSPQPIPAMISTDSSPSAEDPLRMGNKSSTLPIERGGLVPLRILAAELYAKHQAPCPPQGYPPQLLPDVFAGWINPDSCRTGLLHMTEQQLFRRLTVGRHDAIVTALYTLYDAFLHVAARGTAREFHEKKDLYEKGVAHFPDDQLASVTMDGIPVIFDCIHRPLGGKHDIEALQKLQTATKNRSVLIDETLTTLGAKTNDSVTWLEFLTYFGHIPEEALATPLAAPSPRSIISLMKLHASFASIISALQLALKAIKRTLEHEKDSRFWFIESNSDSFRHAIRPLKGAVEFLRACGYLPPVKGSTKMLLEGVFGADEIPLYNSLPDTVLTRLRQVRVEVEAELETLEGVPLLDKSLREAAHDALLVDAAGKIAWNSKLMLAARLLLKYVTNILNNPKDSRTWRINIENPIFNQRIRAPLGDKLANTLMSCIGYHRGEAGETFVLHGTEETGPVASVTPSFPSVKSMSTSDLEAIEERSRMESVTIPPKPVENAADDSHLPFFGYEDLPTGTMAFLVRRRIELEEILFELEQELLELGAAPPPDSLMQVPASLAALDKANTLAPAAQTTVTKAAKKPTLRRPGAKSNEPEGDPLMSRNPMVPDNVILMPILVRGLIVPEETAATVANAPPTGIITLGATARGRRTASVARKGTKATGSGNSIVLNVADPRFSIHNAQLRLLRIAFSRMDKKNIGLVNPDEIMEAFKAEARPSHELTEEFVLTWILSRDLNVDGNVSWPEYAASFAPLFLPPTSGGAGVPPTEEDPKKDKAGNRPVVPVRSKGTDKGISEAELLAQANAEAAAKGLNLARKCLAAEAGVLLNTVIAQIRSVVKGSLPPGTYLEDNVYSLLHLPWAQQVIDVVSGLGFLLLFCDRHTVRKVLVAWMAHISEMVANPSEKSLWTFRVTLPHEAGADAHTPAALAPSALLQNRALSLSSLASNFTRLTDMTIAMDVLQLPGMSLLLEGCGYKPVWDPNSHLRTTFGERTPVAYQLGGEDAGNWSTLPDDVRVALSACAQVLARHAVVFEAPEASDPAAMMLSIGMVLTEGRLVESLIKTVTNSKTAPSKTDNKAATPKRAIRGRGTQPEALDPGDETYDSVFDPRIASKWQLGVDLLERYATNITRAPNDQSYRRINTQTPVFMVRLGNLPAPRRLLLLPTDTEVPQSGLLVGDIWRGTRALTSVGFREMPDAILYLPRETPIAYLQARQMELQAVQPLLRSINALTKARDFAAKHLTPPPPPKPTITALQTRLPTTLLTTVLDPTNARTRRYEEAHVLRGSNRLAELPSEADDTYSEDIHADRHSRSLSPTTPTSPNALVHLESRTFSPSRSHSGSIRESKTSDESFESTPATAVATGSDTAKSSGSRRRSISFGGETHVPESTTASFGVSVIPDISPQELEKRSSESVLYESGYLSSIPGPLLSRKEPQRSSSAPADVSPDKSMARSRSRRLSQSVSFELPPEVPAPRSQSVGLGGLSTIVRVADLSGKVKSLRVQRSSLPVQPPPKPKEIKKTVVDPVKEKAASLVVLGPMTVGGAMLDLLEEKEKTSSESKEKIAALESEVAELRAQIRTQQMAELVPKVKQSLTSLQNQPEVRSSVLAAAVGLGIKVESGAPKGPASKLGIPNTPRGSSPGRQSRSNAARDPKSSGKASDKAKLTEKPVVIASPIRLSTPLEIGATEGFVRAFPDDLDGGHPPEIMERLAAGEIFVPPALQLKGGDHIMIGSALTSDLVFIRKAIPGGECDRGGDEYKLIFDRPVVFNHELDAFVTKQPVLVESDRAAFYRREIYLYAKNELIPEIIYEAARKGEDTLKLRAAETRYKHRNVPKRVPFAMQVYGDASEIIIPQSSRRSARNQIPNLFAFMCNSGPLPFINNTTAPPGTMTQGFSARAPFQSVATPVNLAMSPSLLAGVVFDMLDYGGVGELRIDVLAARMAKDVVAWSTIGSDATVPLSVLGEPPGGNGQATSTVQPTSYQIWQRLMSVPYTLFPDGKKAPLSTPALTVARHAFTTLFRGLHVLDFVSTSDDTLKFISVAHSGHVNILNDVEAEFWGREWDEGRAEAPLIGDAAMMDIATAFSIMHTEEQLYPGAAWATLTSTNHLGGDPLRPPPYNRLLTIRGAQSVIYMLDGDAPTQEELWEFALRLHERRLYQSRRRQLIIMGENPDAMDIEDDFDDDDDSEEEGGTLFHTESGDPYPYTDSKGRHKKLPKLPYKALSFKDIVRFRVERDKKLLEIAKNFQETEQRFKENQEKVPTAYLLPEKCDRNPNLPSLRMHAERRALFPTPGAPRINLLEAILRVSYQDVRNVLKATIVDKLRKVCEEQEGRVDEVAFQKQSEETVTSIPGHDLIALLQRTDEGRRVLSYPLALVNIHKSYSDFGSEYLTIHSALLHLTKTSNSGNISWAQVSSLVRSSGSVIPSPMDQARGGMDPAPFVPFLGTQLLPPSVHSLVPPSPRDATSNPFLQNPARSNLLLDMHANTRTGSVFVLTADGTLNAFDSTTFNRKWVARCLPPPAARALHWLKTTRFPSLRILAPPIDGTASGVPGISLGEENTPLVSSTTEVNHVVAVNLTVATYAYRLAKRLEPVKAQGLDLFVGEQDGMHDLQEMRMFADAPSAGHVVSRIRPRVLADADLVTMVPENGTMTQIFTKLSQGTDFVLLETMYLADSHIIIGTAVPNNEEMLDLTEGKERKQKKKDQDAQRKKKNATVLWPRLFIFCALTGSCIADLGVLTTAATTGVHLQYNETARHLLASDMMEIFPPAPLHRRRMLPEEDTPKMFAPIVRVWDLAPIQSIVSRFRLAFLRAASSYLGSKAPDLHDVMDSAGAKAIAAALGVTEEQYAALKLEVAKEGKEKLSLFDESHFMPQATSQEDAAIDALVPKVFNLPPMAVLDVGVAAFSPSYTQVTFRQGPPVISMCLLSNSGMLAIAQADGTITMWDTRYKRHRLHYPPTMRIPDENALDSLENSDDPFWTPIPEGCHMVSTLPSMYYYKPAGLLQSSSSPAVLGPWAKLVRTEDATNVYLELASTSSRLPTQHNAMRLNISMAPLPIGLPGLLRNNRLPCRINLDPKALHRAGNITSAFVSQVLAYSSSDGQDTSKETAMVPAKETVDDRALHEEAVSKLSGVYAGYIYAFDDGSVLAVDSPYTVANNLRPNGYPLQTLAALFDPRFISLSDDTYFAAASSADLPPETLSSLKRVIISRQRVARIYFVLSRGVSIGALLPSFAKVVLVAPHGTNTRSSSPSTMSVPLVATPFHTLVQHLALAHDSIYGAAGVAVSAISTIMDICSCTGYPLDKLVSTNVFADSIDTLPHSLPPVLCLPFLAPGDSLQSVMSVLPPSDPSISSAPFNYQELVSQGCYWTTGVVMSTEKVPPPPSGLEIDSIMSLSVLLMVQVALDHEDRVIEIPAYAMEVIETAAATELTLGAPVDISGTHPATKTKNPLPGDRVLVRVRSSGAEMLLGENGLLSSTLSWQSSSALQVPPPAIMNEPQPAADLLAIQVDSFSSAKPIHDWQERRYNKDGMAIAKNSYGVYVRRHLSMWTVGRAEAKVPVQEYYKELPSNTLALMSNAFSRHAQSLLLRAQMHWSTWRAIGIRRMMTRDTITLTRSLSLYDAANSSAGVNATAGALYRAMHAITTSEYDANAYLLRMALSYIWSLVCVAAESEANPRTVFTLSALSKGITVESDSDGISGPRKGTMVGRFFPILVAAVWHYPWFRYALRSLVSIGQQSKIGDEVEAMDHFDDMKSIDGMFGSSEALISRSPTSSPATSPLIHRSHIEHHAYISASASFANFIRLLFTEVGSSTSSNPVDDCHVRITLPATFQSASLATRENVSLDCLFPVLEYLRESGFKDGRSSLDGDGGAGEHMLQSLVRRRALPWDPKALQLLGVADKSSLQALTESTVLGTPLEAFTSAEVSFLIANAPTIASITEPALFSLAKAFADPITAMRHTLGILRQVGDVLHLASLQGDGDEFVPAAQGTSMATVLARRKPRSESHNNLLVFYQFAAHSRILALVSSALGPTILPNYAPSLRVALQRIQNKGSNSYRRIFKKALGGEKTPGAIAAAAARRSNDAARAQLLHTVMTNIFKSLKTAPFSASPYGLDEKWTNNFVLLCNDFASIVFDALHEVPDPEFENDEGLVATEIRSLAILLRLLTHGALEALVQAAVLHTALAIKLPFVPANEASRALEAMFACLGSLFSLLSDDTSQRAVRLMPHIPRLLRAAVVLSTGRCDGIHDDIPADTSTPPTLIHPVVTNLMQPAYVALALPYAAPLFLALCGVDGRGSPNYPSIRRYIRAAGKATSLARGFSGTMDEEAIELSGSPLVTLATCPFIVGFDAFLPGLHRVAASDDSATRLAVDATARRMISWSYSESITQFTKRYAPDRVTEEKQDESRFYDAAPVATSDGSAAGLVALAASGTCHMVSPYSAFRRSAAYWANFIPALTGIAKLHEGIPDPISDVDHPGIHAATANDKTALAARGIGVHIRVMERIACRRHAISRFKFCLRPPRALTAGSPIADTEYGEENPNVGSEQSTMTQSELLGMEAINEPGTGGGFGSDIEVEDIDRGVLVQDLMIPDFVASLMLDNDKEVRKTAFATVRNVALAIAWPSMDAYGGPQGEDNIIAEVEAGSRTSSTYPARARVRKWTDLHVRFAQPDVVTAIARRLQALVLWARKFTNELGATGALIGVPRNLFSQTGVPESESIVRYACDILSAHIASRVSIPSIWRLNGVLPLLARLAKLGVPRIDLNAKYSKPTTKQDTSVWTKRMPMTKHLPKVQKASAPPPPHPLGDISLPDLILRRICTDHGNEALLCLARYDPSVSVWAAEKGVAIVRDGANSWMALHAVLHEAMDHLTALGIMDHFTVTDATMAAEMEVGSTEEKVLLLENDVANTLAAVLQELSAHLPSLKRNLLLEFDKLSRGAGMDPQYNVAAFHSVIEVMWILTNAAWTLCARTKPRHRSRTAAYAWLNAILDTAQAAVRKGCLCVSIFLGCPLDTEFSSIQWSGLRCLVRLFQHPLPVRVLEPDHARLPQARASIFLGEVLSKALDTLALPFTAGHADADEVAARRSSAERAYAVAILAQTVDLNITKAYISNIRASKHFLVSVANARTLPTHIFAQRGQALALSFTARSLIWTALLRSALLRLPTKGRFSGVTASMLTKLAVAYTQQICNSGIFTVLIREMLPCDVLLDTMLSPPPHAIAAFAGTYAVRVEASVQLYILSVLFLHAQAWLDATIRMGNESGTGVLLTVAAAGIGGTITAMRRAAEATAKALLVTNNDPDEFSNAKAPKEMTVGALLEDTLPLHVAATKKAPPSQLEIEKNGLAACLEKLQEHLDQVCRTEGIVSAERKRIWQFKDVALAPTIPIVLQSLLFAIPRSEYVRVTYEELTVPQAAFSWFRSTKQLFLAAFQPELRSRFLQVQSIYAAEERASTINWAKWRAQKLQQAPGTGEDEAGRKYAAKVDMDNEKDPGPVAATLALAGVQLAPPAHTIVEYMKQHGRLPPTSAIAPPPVPPSASTQSEYSNVGGTQSLPSAHPNPSSTQSSVPQHLLEQYPDGVPMEVFLNWQAQASNGPSGSFFGVNSAVSRRTDAVEGANADANVSKQTTSDFHPQALDIPNRGFSFSTASPSSLRMPSTPSTTSKLGESTRAFGKTNGFTSSQSPLVPFQVTSPGSFDAILSKLGNSVVYIQRAFTSAAIWRGVPKEQVLPSNDATLLPLLRELGVGVPPALLAAFRGAPTTGIYSPQEQGFLPSDPNVPISLSVFARLVVRIMELQGVKSLPILQQKRAHSTQPFQSQILRASPVPASPLHVRPRSKIFGDSDPNSSESFEMSRPSLYANSSAYVPSQLSPRHAGASNASDAGASFFDKGSVPPSLSAFPRSAHGAAPFFAPDGGAAAIQQNPSLNTCNAPPSDPLQSVFAQYSSNPGASSPLTPQRQRGIPFANVIAAFSAVDIHLEIQEAMELFEYFNLSATSEMNFQTFSTAVALLKVHKNPVASPNTLNQSINSQMSSDHFAQSKEDPMIISRSQPISIGAKHGRGQENINQADAIEEEDYASDLSGSYESDHGMDAYPHRNEKTSQGLSPFSKSQLY